MQKAHTWQAAGASGRTKMVGKAEFWLVAPFDTSARNKGENVLHM
jgi:hypothetical protein